MSDAEAIIPDEVVENLKKEGAIPQEPIEKDPTHDHDEEALDDAAEKMGVEEDSE